MSGLAWVTLALAAVAVGALAWALALARPARAREGGLRDAERRLRMAERASEATRADAALREDILGSMSEAVILAEGTAVAYANPAALRMFGVEAMRTLPPQVAEPPETGERTVEVAVHHPAYRELRCVVARIGDGKTLVVAQDVTARERLDRVRRDFVANASHELKTPVAAILATAETLPDAVRDDPEAAERFAATLAREAKSLSNLVEDLLDLTRLEQAVTGAEPVDLSSVVRTVVGELRERVGRRALGAAIEERISVRGAAEDLALMTRNLLDNAIRYTPDGGSIDVALRALDGRAVLEVRDTGIGIPQKDLPRIFERFYRVDRARSRETGGTGLGLSLVRHVVESHGGTVEADSELGAGSTFTVSLPLA